MQSGAVVWRSKERGVRCRVERLFGGVNRGSEVQRGAVVWWSK